MNDSIDSALTYFTLAALGTVGLGVYITLLADEIAERTRLGRAVVGAILLGMLTSVAEIGTSISAAITQHAELAVNNAVGSIAAQTAFIAVADLAYRRANLEHAAASVPNLMLTGILILLIGCLTLAASTSQATLFGWIHPISAVVLGMYVYGMWLVSNTDVMSMWQVRQTQETSTDEGRKIVHSGSLAWLWTRFAVVAVLLMGFGVLLAETGIAITRLTGLTESFVGVLLTGVTSSMPELVTAITAVRIGALSLAISNIMGGNAFDTTIVALSDLVYPGSIYAAAGSGLLTLLSAVLIMNTIALLGLIRRERYGLGNIGLEGVALLAVYGGIVFWLGY